MASPSRVALPSSEPAFSLLLCPKQDTPVMSLNSSDVSSSWSRVCRGLSPPPAPRLRLTRWWATRCGGQGLGPQGHLCPGGLLTLQGLPS